MELLGRGAFGEVYRAHQLNLKRDVAIKIVSPEMLALFEDDAEEIENTLNRFQREVQSMAQVRHPNILQIIDHGATSLKKMTKVSKSNISNYDSSGKSFQGVGHDWVIRWLPSLPAEQWGTSSESVSKGTEPAGVTDRTLDRLS